MPSITIPTSVVFPGSMIPCSVLLYGLDDAELLGIARTLEEARGRVGLGGRGVRRAADARRGALSASARFSTPSTPSTRPPVFALRRAAPPVVRRLARLRARARAR